ncbi:MAG: hypothetical protein ACK4TA_22125 [Saprospiraceae bacterium]
MTHDYYLPANDEERGIWLNNFAGKLPQYAHKYAITPDELSDITKSAAYFDAFIKYRNQLTAFQKSLTEHRNAVADGLSNGTVLPPPTPPAMLLPEPVPMGIFKRVRALVGRIKAHVNYSEADGRDLGLIGAAQPAKDFNTAKPYILLQLVAGGRPEVLWNRQGMSALEIQKHTGDGKWRTLTLDTVPNYIDREPLPPSGQSEVWYYRAIYHYKDERVGQWSDEVRITVTGA